MAIKAAWQRMSAGVWSGLFAALVLIAASLVLRWTLGIGTLPELLSDRIAPLMGIHLFFFLIGALKSYALLKQIGIVSMLLNELLAGLLFGLFYTWQLRAAPGKATARLLGAVGISFVLLIAFLWGNLRTSYIGLPPGSARPLSVAGLLLCAVLFAAAVIVGHRLLVAPAGATNSGVTDPGRTNVGRRALVLGGSSTALGVFSAVALARFYRVASYGYDGTVNAGTDLPAVTPNNKFYSVTKNNVDPAPTLRAWALEIKGNVRTPMKLGKSELQAMPHLSQQTTLQCISNPVGGNLSSNAVWTGVPLRELLTRAGASGKAVQLMMFGADGFVDTIPMETAMHPYTLIAYQMNGTDLPVHHGYPVRLIVPGYVGEKSVKWLTALEVREREGEGFYEEQGWGPHFMIENSSRFDTPSDGDEMKLHEPVVLHGEAFAGDRGVRAVQVSTDGGDTWTTAELTYAGTKLTWAQWRYRWTPATADDYTLVVRCIDGQGGIQSDAKHGPGPGQSSGQQEVNVTVKA